jgi:hypothetical protein
MTIIIFTLSVIVGAAVATVGWALWADRAMRSGL